MKYNDQRSGLRSIDTIGQLSGDAIEKKITTGINRAAVYRVLNRFYEDGVLHKVVADNGKRYFAICSNCEDKVLAGDHFHFRCLNCETIECLPVPVDFMPPKGYQVRGVNCMVTGTCSDCTV